MPKVDAAKLKNEAQKFLQRGKLDKALETYIELEKAAKNDLRVPQKIAEIFQKLGDKKKAIEKYKETADKYLEKGFLVQAIAINKIILEIDPAESEAKAKLDKLMNERHGPSGSFNIKAPEPKAPEKPFPPLANIPPPAKAAEEVSVSPVPPAAVKKPVKPESAAAAEDDESIPMPDDSESVELDQSDDAGPEVSRESDEISSLDEEPGAAEAESAASEPEHDQLLPEQDEAVALPDEEDELAFPAEDVPKAPPEKTVAPIEANGHLPEKGPDRTPLFSDLKSGEFDRVFELLRSKMVNPKEDIVKKGDKGDSIFIIARGNVEIVNLDQDDREYVVANLGPGDFFGEFGYFAGAVRTATVRAKTQVHLLELTKQDTDDVTREFPRVKEVLFQFYKERVVDNLLAQSQLFKKLSYAERHAFMSKCKLVEFEDGESIVKEGDPGDSMFVIKRGEVEVVGTNPLNQQQMTLANLKAGDFFGEVSLVKRKPRTATINSIGPVEVLEFHRSAYDEIAPSHPEITKVLEEIIEKRVEKTIQMVTGSVRPKGLI